MARSIGIDLRLSGPGCIHHLRKLEVMQVLQHAVKTIFVQRIEKTTHAQYCLYGFLESSAEFTEHAFICTHVTFMRLLNANGELGIWTREQILERLRYQHQVPFEYDLIAETGLTQPFSGDCIVLEPNYEGTVHLGLETFTITQV